MSALKVLADPVRLGSAIAMASTWAHGAMGPHREGIIDSVQGSEMASVALRKD